MRTIIVGKGIQGLKRKEYCGDDFVGFVDPLYDDTDTAKDINKVSLNCYDAAIVCVPYADKYAILSYCLFHGKHVLVEKPLTLSAVEFKKLKKLSEKSGAILYTAYNHRFEPHLIRMKSLLDSGALGRIYSYRMYYGNGTAQNVKNTWRDKSILQEIGSHMIDIVKWWAVKFPKPVQAIFSRSETNSCDHVMLHLGEDGYSPFLLEMSWLSWRNTFTVDIIGSNGSAHIDGLCKWGPSTFTYRQRVYPSGKPIEEKIVLEISDPTWAAEYDHFKSLIEIKRQPDLSWDSEMQNIITELERGIS